MPAEPRRRHNGQLQACEPCRKAKIRCDHGSPNCSRCVTRNLNCIYHPHPMTNRRPPPPISHAPRDVETTPSVGLRTVPADPQLHIEPASVAEISLPSVADPGSIATSGPSVDKSGAKRNKLFQKEVGEHETTRFSAIFFENQESLGPLILDATNANHDSGRQPDVTAWPQMELAINTLLNFPTASTCDILMKDLHRIHDVWVSPTMIQQCLAQVWSEYGHCLHEPRTRQSVLRMANDLFLNDTKPHSMTNRDADNVFNRTGWMNWFAGPELRWEMIGILFSWTGIAFRHRQEWDSVFDLPEQQGLNRNTAAAKMRECAAACLRLCEDHFEISDLMVICMKNSTKLQSIIISDESDRIRVDYGTVGSAFITAGLHRLPPLKEVTPFSQHRASIASSMYYLDKCESLFNARPPMLSRHYCQCPLPLDLCEEDIYGGRERLAAAVAKLDSNGWSTDGRIFTATWLRALAMLSPIREGILELSISANQQFSKLQVENLVVQLRQIVDSYPPKIQYHHHSKRPTESISCSRDQSPHDMFIITRIQLDVLQCHFLLQRLLVSREFSCGQHLFDIAQETLSIILSLWLNRDQYPDFNHFFDWIAVSYGMPCAGILCVELLRANDLAPPAPVTDSSTAAGVQVPAHFSRSGVIQSLTMFIALLDWIRPTDNNAELSSKFKKVLQRIIDAVFDSLRPLQGAQMQQMPSENQPQGLYDVQTEHLEGQNRSTITGNQYDLDFALTTITDMNWLNTVDWTQGDWLEHSTQYFLH